MKKCKYSTACHILIAYANVFTTQIILEINVPFAEGPWLQLQTLDVEQNLVVDQTLTVVVV